MYKVNILASDQGLFSTVFGPFEMLIQAGVFWNALVGKPANPYFDVNITSVDGIEINGLNGSKIQPHRKINNSDQYDLIIVPSEGININPESTAFSQRVDYLKNMHNKGAVIASICTGAFLLASTGLLKNKVATTHWALEYEFKRLFPEVDLNTNLLIADNDKVITAGGVSADQDLSMHLISRYCGQEVALQTARCTLTNVSTREQSPFKSFIINKNHGDQQIVACQTYIEKHLNDNFSVSELSEKFSMVTRTLNRRFKQATGYTVVNYIQQLKVEKAKQILEREKVSFDEIAHRLGYENVSYCRRLFKQYVGLSPKEYRQAFYRNSQL